MSVDVGGLADRVRALREQSLMTQEELAAQAGVSVGTVRGVETGRIRRPRSGTMRLLARALRLTECELLEFAAMARPIAPGPFTDPSARIHALPAQLPAGNSNFAGRADSLRLLDELLTPGSSAAMVGTIVGTAGAGKTALAIQWAHAARSRFPDGQLYADLRGYHPIYAPTSPTAVLRGFLHALGLPVTQLPDNIEAQTGLYRSLLANRRMLIVLDNARDAHQIRPLLPGAAGCLVLVTSRDGLSGLVAEGSTHLVTLGLLSHREAQELLIRRLGPHRVVSELAAANEVIRLCARLPLALAAFATRATRHPDFSLRALLHQLRDEHERLEILSSGDATTDLRSSFACSYRTLTPAAAHLFRLVGQHREPEVDVSAIADLAELTRARVRPLLAELTRAHLVQEHRPDRYTVHALLRAYATELPNPSIADTSLRRVAG